jgi:capsule biosynthesis phosphatase
MKYILLCGGIGSRNKKYSLPKPLNYIEGRHMIEYNIESIPSKEIYIIYNHILEKYNFEEIVINKFKTHTIHFCKIDYLTRGAVESAYIGINYFDFLDNEQCLFIDNDNIHIYPKQMETNSESFIGYNIDYVKTCYSFIKIKDNNTIIDIAEKDKISDYFCCGLYGFSNKIIFKKYAQQLFESNIKNKNEFYFSALYKLMIQNEEIIRPIKIEHSYHFGSLKEIEDNIITIQSKQKLRICFDLDNTLVTYPTIPNDYTSVKPIISNINLLKKLKQDGHEIIIHTARRMKTHNHNIGKVIKDIAIITLNTLNDLDIPYDEIIFGKPIADIYIDDRAINPYINDISYFGLFINNCEDIGLLSVNKNNTIYKYDDIVIKSGPYNIIKGELYFYQNIPDLLKKYFCKFIDYSKNEDIISLKMSYESGIPLYYLYKNELVTENMLKKLIDNISTFHSYENSSGHNSIINKDDIYAGYVYKLKDRVNKYITEYNFDGVEELLNDIISGIDKHFSPKIVNMIHGDLWFSNIILNYNDEFKFIDMKGIVNDKLTLMGDIYYDFGKLFQSILGLDLILNDAPAINETYLNRIKNIFLSECEKLNLNINYLRYVTKSLIFGIFWALPPSILTNKRNKIINLIKCI